MAEIDLHYVNELIEVRQEQHGGGRGAPPIVNGHRIGASLNRSCIVMLSALLQSYVEEEFKEAAKRRFPTLEADPDAFDAYWKQMKGWGNPSDANIKHLFLKLGIPDALAGLRWQHTDAARVRTKLRQMNEIRNQIAHGTRQLRLDQADYSLELARVIAFRNFVEQFAVRFTSHIVAVIPEPAQP